MKLLYYKLCILYISTKHTQENTWRKIPTLKVNDLPSFGIMNLPVAKHDKKKKNEYDLYECIIYRYMIH